MYRRPRTSCCGLLHGPRDSETELKAHLVLVLLASKDLFEGKATTEEVLKEFENWEDEVKVLIEVRMTGGLRALF